MQNTYFALFKYCATPHFPSPRLYYTLLFVRIRIWLADFISNAAKFNPFLPQDICHSEQDTSL